jgi:dTDP-4-dehydrorhamnose 3,5-epimerase
MIDYKIEETFIQDVLIITPKIFEDDRGVFIEVFNKSYFDFVDVPTNFVQMNHSRSKKNVIRGLHFQWDPPMGKLMRVTRGSAFLVAVDIRKESPTLGMWYGNIFSEENKKQIWAPAGFARGICSLEDDTEVQYLITGEYTPKNESEILWNDPELKITWPIFHSDNLSLSEKDKKAQTFSEWLKRPESNNFKFVKHERIPNVL